MVQVSMIAVGSVELAGVVVMTTVVVAAVGVAVVVGGIVVGGGVVVGGGAVEGGGVKEVGVVTAGGGAGVPATPVERYVARNPANSIKPSVIISMVSTSPIEK